MWERHIDDDMDVELMLEQGAQPDSALLVADGAQSDAPLSDPEPESAEQAAPPSTSRLSWGARCQMPSRGRLAIMHDIRSPVRSMTTSGWQRRTATGRYPYTTPTYAGSPTRCGAVRYYVAVSHSAREYTIYVCT